MRRTIKTFLTICGLATLSALSAWGYALLGPGIGGGTLGDSWETPSIGYGIGGDIGTPKNIGEEYRRNTPVIYYTYDANFLDFFGSNGVVAIDGAFAIMNALTNVDNYSQSLSEFPLNSQQSFDASAAGLTDLRSTTLYLLMEQMGLAEPERYVWTLHDRYLPSGGKCPLDEEYLVVQRNYDPVSQVYSSYVNGTLFTYDIAEFCSPPVPPDSITEPYPVDESITDPTVIHSAVAGLGDGLQLGNYYTSLTRDDMGGLRYLLSTNNMNVEDPAPGSELEVTNFSGSAFSLLQTSDLGALLQFAQTNSPSALQTAYPDLVIDGYSIYYTIVSNPIVVAYYTNSTGNGYGNPPTLIVQTNSYTYTPQTNYVYTFGNVVIVHYYTNTAAKLQTISVTNQIGAGYPSPLYTNVTTKTIILTNVPSGDYYIIPPDSCGFDIVSNIFLNVPEGTTTNTIVTATNFEGYSLTQSILTTFTNNWYGYFPCNFQTNGPALYQGVKKIQFVRADYDSLLSQVWNPVTNYYTMVTVTNSKPVTQYFRRIVTQPDILFSAQDLASPNVAQIGVSEGLRNVNFDPNQVLNNLDGPGTIYSPSTISYNKVGDIYFQGGLASSGLNTNQFVNETNAYFYPNGDLLSWGSFDNSTNAPIVYPDGTSIQNLEYQIFIQISPTTLPDGDNGATYSTTTFTATGGSFTSPYSWSLGIDPLTQKRTTLPNGLTLSSNGTISGTPNGNAPGVYDFIIEMTDYVGRSVTWNYSMTIDH